MTERETLFRPEVLPRSAARHAGMPLLQHHGLSAVFVLVSTVLVAAALLLLAFTRYREAETARGILEPAQGSHRVVAPVAAIVTHVAVQAGDVVDRGQVLAELQRAGFDAQGNPVAGVEIAQLRKQDQLLQAQAALQARQFHSARQQAQMALADFNAAADLLATELALSREALQLSDKRVAALTTLSAARAITPAQLEQAELENLELQLRLQSVLQRRQAHDVQRQAQVARLQNMALEYEQVQLAAEQELQRLQFAITQIENQTRQSVVATSAGMIATVAVESGQSVQALQPLFYVQTEPLALQAILYVPSRILGRLYPGQEVLLSYDAFDMQHYGRYVATIQRIDHASLDPREHLLPVPGIQEPVFRITAQLAQAWVEGDDVYRLQSGMLFSADIVMQELSLLEYIFKPVLQLRARIA